ncbi:MAG TPA: aldehyde ferredoxin oxidoreductase family protein [Anaerolineae bacterium]|nr:aldehyde ferredoxin oxidoreductase family protein [Anaerolineae bacterium]HPL28623.1 aldehyde ferredoxin oxidoreductase family protein [Anaerolineae bacterium]
MFGYGGRILRVDLTSGRAWAEPLPHELARDYLGGRGFGAYLLYREVPQGADPMGADNRLYISAGPLSGLLVPGAGKCDIACKSPLTGGYAGANVGGLLAAELKYAGYDAIAIQGAAAKPVYLLIDDDRVELRDAMPFWGQGSLSAEQALKTALGEEFQIATIGPAGEAGVPYACISHDFGRQAGRGGVGAVMGAKRLKAIAVRGTRSIPVADPARYRELARAMYAACKASPGLEAWQKYGTAGVVTWANEIGAFPTRNFGSGFFEGHPSLSGQTMREAIVVTDKACFGCPSPCGKYSHSTKHGVYVEGPEYETSALFGGNCALSDIEDVAYANYLCDQLGLDTISAGNAIAFAIECFQRGIIGLQETGGLELRFGDPGIVYTLLGQIAARQGLGAVLARGVRHAAAVWGHDAAAYAIEIKGMEMSGYESRHAPAMLLAYMTCDVGAHHNRAWAITYDIAAGRDAVTPDKAAKVIELQHVRPLFDSLGACRLQWVELSLDLGHYAPIIEAITGVKRTWQELLTISERAWNLTRLYWLREVPGFGRAWDAPPERVWREPVAGGPTAGAQMAREDIERLLDMYYEQRGWDSDGRPTPAKLAQLGLDRL